MEKNLSIRGIRSGLGSWSYIACFFAPWRQSRVNFSRQEPEKILGITKLEQNPEPGPLKKIPGAGASRKCYTPPPKKKKYIYKYM